jgi:hypothetical protein
MGGVGEGCGAMRITLEHAVTWAPTCTTLQALSGRLLPVCLGPCPVASEVHSLHSHTKTEARRPVSGSSPAPAHPCPTMFLSFCDIVGASPEDDLSRCDLIPPSSSLAWRLLSPPPGAGAQQ